MLQKLESLSALFPRSKPARGRSSVTFSPTASATSPDPTPSSPRFNLSLFRSCSSTHSASAHPHSSERGARESRQPPRSKPQHPSRRSKSKSFHLSPSAPPSPVPRTLSSSCRSKSKSFHFTSSPPAGPVSRTASTGSLSSRGAGGRPRHSRTFTGEVSGKARRQALLGPARSADGGGSAADEATAAAREGRGAAAAEALLDEMRWLASSSSLDEESADGGVTSREASKELLSHLVLIENLDAV